MNIVTKLLTFRDQAHILHWQTRSYSEHVALGGLYEGLDDLIDGFMETFMGKYGRVMAKDSFNIPVANYSDYSPLQLASDMEKYLVEELPTMLDPKKDTDLLNIRDEMLALANKTKYLLSLK